MRQVLLASGITKEETDRNPQAVLDVLNFHMEGIQTPPPKLPSRASVARNFSDAMVIKQEDYNKYYSNLKKLGLSASAARRPDS